MPGLEGLLKAIEAVGWLKESNVPVLGCRGARGSLCWRVRGDYWLAGIAELELLDRLFRRWFGVVPGFARERRLAVLHRIPAPGGEYAFEVFAEAARLGVVEYVAGRGWILHPSGAAASISASIGARTCTVKAHGRLKGKRVRLPASCRAGWEGWSIVEASGWVGPAKPVGEELFKVKDMAPKGMKLLKPGSLDEAAEANAEVVGGLAAEAREFIRRVYTSRQAGRGKLYVAFSGGADSTAVLSLAREAVGPENVVAVYVDTRLEFPETRRYVEKVASILGVDLEVVEAEADPVEEIARRGIMTRDNRWCTRLLKLEPLRKFYEKHGVKLVLDGARRWESENRARTPRISVNPLIPSVVRALPVYHWPRLVVQLYLYERGIPVNQLYHYGLTRIGCIICPAMHLHEIHTAYTLHDSILRGLAGSLASKTGCSTERLLALLLAGVWRKAVCSSIEELCYKHPSPTLERHAQAIQQHH